MKRNLFAIFLAMALVVALVFVVAPSAKADSYAFSEEVQELEITNDAVLDLAGFSGKVTLTNGAKLTVYDSGNSSKTGADAAKLTVEGDGSVEKISLQKGYRYLKVENADGTYSFHPFNMAFTHVGLNTKTNSVCVRVAFVANDVVKAKLTDYGIYSVEFDAYASSQEKYPFGEQNGVYAYYDFINSFGTDDMDATKPVKLYMTVDGETIETEYTANIIPREVLKKVNKAGTSIANEPQLDRITDMIDGNDRIANILLNFQAEPSTDTISFANQNALVSSSATEQIWKQAGVKLTYAKSTSTNDLVLNTNPARFYANTMVTIDALNITKIVFDCNTSDYANTLNASIGTVSGASVSVSSDKVTVTFTNPVNSFVIKKMSAQVRVDAITVSASTAPSCAHMKDLSEATCTKKAICIDCDAEHGNTLPHVEKTAATCTAKAICLNCGNAYGNTLPHDITSTATCQAPAQCANGHSVGDVVDCADSDSNGQCDWCGTTLAAKETVTVSKTAAQIMTLAGLSANNSTVINGKTANLDNYISVTPAKGNAGTAPTYYTSGTAIRLYQNGAILTVKAAAGAEMKTIVLTAASGGQGPIAVTGGTASVTGGKYTITVNPGVSEVVIKTTGTSSSTRLYLSNISVTYDK